MDENEQLNGQEQSTASELANMGSKAASTIGGAANLALGMGKKLHDKKKSDEDKKEDDKNKKDKKDEKGENKDDSSSGELQSDANDLAKAGGKVAKKGMKFAGKGLKELWKLIPSSWKLFVLIGIVLIILLFFVFLILMGGSSQNVSYYATTVEGKFLCNMTDPSSSHDTISGSAFGWRYHPVYFDVRFHYGVDLHGGECDAPLYAVQDGVVNISRKADYGGYGKYVQIKHTGTYSEYSTLYAHMSSVVVDVGDVVSQGDLLGYVGTTGTSTGCHLHFELKHNGVNISPNAYFGKDDSSVAENCVNTGLGITGSESSGNISFAKGCQYNYSTISFEDFQKKCTEGPEQADMSVFMQYQNYWEGGTSNYYSCNNGNGYAIYEDIYNVPTTALGFTWTRIETLINAGYTDLNDYFSYGTFVEGTCIPNDIFMKLSEYNYEYSSNYLDRQFDNACGYDVSFNSYETAALVDLFHSGPAFTQTAAYYYCNYGEQSMFNYMVGDSVYLSDSNGGVHLRNRRKCGVTLYETGDYTCNGKIDIEQ